MFQFGNIMLACWVSAATSFLRTRWFRHQQARQTLAGRTRSACAGHLASLSRTPAAAGVRGQEIS